MAGLRRSLAKKVYWLKRVSLFATSSRARLSSSKGAQKIVGGRGSASECKAECSGWAGKAERGDRGGCACFEADSGGKESSTLETLRDAAALFIAAISAALRRANFTEREANDWFWGTIVCVLKGEERVMYWTSPNEMERWRWWRGRSRDDCLDAAGESAAASKSWSPTSSSSSNSSSVAWSLMADRSSVHASSSSPSPSPSPELLVEAGAAVRGLDEGFVVALAAAKGAVTVTGAWEESADESVEQPLRPPGESASELGAEWRTGVVVVAAAEWESAAACGGTLALSSQPVVSSSACSLARDD
ncbi:hypothetical protein DFJ73DRAFT_961916 [Zopfochytrium polystomum]|nr:hypothetical protein DFJ73DRAFT_961916 [Zopfochytrium polystomum]